jgi:hypothetical protein
MLTDSERFAFLVRRYHGFATTGKAYDATQTDDRIATGDSLLILPEGVIGIAHCWPFAVTAACGKLHSISPKPSDTIAAFAASFSIADRDITAAVDLARALGFALDPAIADLLARVG